MRLNQGGISEVVQQERSTLEMFQSHRASLIYYARRIIGSESQAEDIVPNAGIRFQLARNSAPLREPLHYLYRIVRNLAINGKHRTRLENKGFEHSADFLEDSLVGDAPSSEDVPLARNELNFICAGLHRLNVSILINTSHYTIFSTNALLFGRGCHFP